MTGLSLRSGHKKLVVITRWSQGGVPLFLQSARKLLFIVLLFFRFSSFDEENAQFCCENIAAHLEHTLEWEREMVIKRQQEVRSL